METSGAGYSVTTSTIIGVVNEVIFPEGKSREGYLGKRTGFREVQSLYFEKPIYLVATVVIKRCPVVLNGSAASMVREVLI